MEVDINLSNKMNLLFSILDGMEKEDKILVFSQRIQTLDIIEHFMTKTKCVHTGKDWQKDEDFVRIDGQTKNRNVKIKKFRNCAETR